MNINRVFLFLLFGLLAVTAAATDPPTGQVKLVEDLTIGGPDKDELFLWTGISVDRDGNIYFADALDCTVKKFGPDGRFLKKAGGKGKGPGEFEKTVGVVAAGETVFAWDVYARMVQVFDRELVYQRTLPVSGTVGALDAFPDGRLVAAVRESTAIPSLLILSPSGVKLNRMILSESADPFLFDSISLATDPSDGFYLGFLFSDRVEKRNGRGEPVWSKTPFGGRKASLESVAGFKVPSETCIQDLAVDQQGRLYVLGGGIAAHPGRDVLIFNPDGTAAGTFILPEPSHSLYFDRENRLYVSADSGVTMKRYRLISGD